MKIVDITDKEYNSWKVIGPGIRDKYNRLKWRCRCKCGFECNISKTSLKSGRSKECASLGSKSGSWKGFGLISGKFWKGIIACSNKRNIEISIDIKYIYNKFLEQNGKCKISGVNLKFNSRSNLTDGNASLDRINSKLGYIEGNVQWVHKDINSMKSNMTDEKFINWCRLVTENNKVNS